MDTTAAAMGYHDSVDSSPRSRCSESWDEPSFPSSAAAAAAVAASKLRLMCSYGGRIVPRPTDKSLCYLGGESRIVIVDRHSSLSDLHAKVSRTLLNGKPFVLKYQLPSEDLDSLISITSDEDLDNMIEEYDRILSSAGNSRSSSRLRLFLFPGKPDTSASAPSSMSSLLDDSKSESWFVDALNGTMEVGGFPRGLSGDSASVNSLLGLVEDSSAHSRRGGGGNVAMVSPGAAAVEYDQIALARPDSSGRLASVPDSPVVVETVSSFGSANSVPSLSNFPPTHLRPDDRPPDPRLEDHFAHMNFSSAVPPPPQQRMEDGYVKEGYAIQQQLPRHPPPIPLPKTLASPPTISPTENPNRVFPSDEEKPVHSGALKAPSSSQQPHFQTKSSSTDAPISGSIPRQPVYYQDRAPANPIVADVKTQVKDQSYILAPPPQPVAPPSVQLEHLQQPQKQQFIQANPHFIHHPSAGRMLAMPQYYPFAAHPMPQSQPQIPMYYMHVQPNTAYNLTDTKPATAPVANTALPQVSVSRTADTQLINMSHADQGASQAAYPAHLPMAYQVMHHHPSQAVTNYGYEIADPAGSSQILYTQTTSSPAMTPQYRPVSSTVAASTIPEPSPADLKAARAS